MVFLFRDFIKNSNCWELIVILAVFSGKNNWNIFDVLKNISKKTKHFLKSTASLKVNNINLFITTICVLTVVQIADSNCLFCKANHFWFHCTLIFILSEISMRVTSVPFDVIYLFNHAHLLPITLNTAFAYQSSWQVINVEWRRIEIN